MASSDDMSGTHVRRLCCIKMKNGHVSAENNKSCSPNSIFDHLNSTYIKVAIILFIYLATGTICFYLTRHQITGDKTHNVVDALYFTIVTMTSVGYGDLYPGTNLTILLACLFVFMGTLLVGLVLSKAADILVDKQERLLSKAFHMDQNLSRSEIIEKIKTNKVRNKCVILVILLLVLMAIGTCFFVFVEHLDFVHAFYCVVGTITSLGYIDKCFSTKGGRIFALFWILLGTIYLAQLLFSFALFNTERRQRSLVRWVLQRRTTLDDLEAADLDHDGTVVASEFVIYKLKEMGKIKQEDITPIMEEFEKLDFDKTGTLSFSDILLSQNTTNT